MTFIHSYVAKLQQQNVAILDLFEKKIIRKQTVWIVMAAEMPPASLKAAGKLRSPTPRTTFAKINADDHHDEPGNRRRIFIVGQRHGAHSSFAVTHKVGNVGIFVLIIDFYYSCQVTRVFNQRTMMNFILY